MVSRYSALEQYNLGEERIGRPVILCPLHQHRWDGEEICSVAFRFQVHRQICILFCLERIAVFKSVLPYPSVPPEAWHPSTTIGKGVCVVEIVIQCLGSATEPALGIFHQTSPLKIIPGWLSIYLSRSSPFFPGCQTWFPRSVPERQMAGAVVCIATFNVVTMLLQSIIRSSHKFNFTR